MTTSTSACQTDVHWRRNEDLLRLAVANGLERDAARLRDLAGFHAERQPTPEEDEMRALAREMTRIASNLRAGWPMKNEMSQEADNA